MAQVFHKRPWVQFLAVLLLLGITALVFARRVHKERRKNSLRLTLIELERKTLRAQMNPHFIFNALNNVRHTAKQGKLAKLDTYIANFATLMRQTLDLTRHEKSATNHTQDRCATLKSNNLTRIILLVLLLAISKVYSKNGLEGKWFCHIVTYQDGKELEVNHPLFSNFLSYEFSSGLAYISNNYKEKGIASNFKLSGSQLEIGFRKFSFSFKDKFLVLKEHGIAAKRASYFARSLVL